jgi:hypothetical protein
MVTAATTYAEASDHQLAEIFDNGTESESHAAVTEIYRRLGLDTNPMRWCELRFIDALDNFLAGQGF